MRRISATVLRTRVMAFILVSVALPSARAADWQTPAVDLPDDVTGPMVATTAAELDRLRQAYESDGPAHAPVAAVIAAADAFLAEEIVFPPRGSQHNQWYQCKACQLALKTLSPTRHKCPRCGKVYSGRPYDDVVFGHVHSRNVAGMADCAWAYAITGERRYADRTAEVLLGYADRYLKYPYHNNRLFEAPTGANGPPGGGHLEEQTLDEAFKMVAHIAPAYDLIRQSAALSEADRIRICKALIEPMLANIDRNKRGKSNWQTWHNAAMLSGGAVMRDVAWVRKAILDPENGFIYQMEASLTDDGMWYENSWGYHFYAMRAIVATAEGARRLDIDLWSHPKLRKMATVAIAYAMPDGKLPRFGDDVNTSIRAQHRLLEAAYHAYCCDSILSMLPEKPAWETILYGRDWTRRAQAAALDSEIFPAAGHAILRTRGPAGLAAALTFGPYGGFHGHLDKLSFVFYGLGQELGVDPGRAGSQAYRLPIHRQWYKATISHNAVLVDGASQSPASGKLEWFGKSDTCAGVAVRCDEAYEDVQHRRVLVLMPSYLLVFDHLVGLDREHRFDWLYHNRGLEVVCDDALMKHDDMPATSTAAEHADAGTPRMGEGRAYLQNVRYGRSDEPIHVRIKGSNLTTHVLHAAAADTTILTGDGPGASVLKRVPMMSVGRCGRDVCFAAVIEPAPSDTNRLVRALEWTRRGDGHAIEIRTDTGRDSIEVASDGRLVVRRNRERLFMQEVANP